MKQDQWAERLEKHIANHREMPKRDLWEGIEAALDKQARRQARLVAFRRWGIAAVLVGLMAGGAYVLWNREAARAEDMFSDPAKIIASNDKPAMKKVEDTSRKVEDFMRKQEDALRIVEEASRKEEDSSRIEEDFSKKEENSSGKEEYKGKCENTPPIIVENKDETILPPPSSLLPPRNNNPRRLSMSLYASGGANGYKGRNGVLMSPSYLQQFTMTRAADSKVYLTGYEERQNHDFPLSFGLTFSYPLTNRLAVSTGVVYTKLNSDFLTLMLSQQIKRHQSLHYIGIPLNLQYALWQWRGLNVYLSAGGQVDWNVKAEANTDGVDQEMNKDWAQWSVGGSLGVLYDFIPQIGIYVEPGIRHYFDNGSHVSNFFKDKPTDFNLQLGLRFHF